MSDDATLLGALLAVIHRDGGHHQQAVGSEKAVADAVKIWHERGRMYERLGPLIRALEANPDLRIGQLLVGASGNDLLSRQLFYMSDEDLEARLDELRGDR